MMRFRLSEIPPPMLISALSSYNLLPAIIFLPSRRRCDESAMEVAQDESQKIDKERRRVREEIYGQFSENNPEIKHHKHRKILLRSGVASHHAGHIPAWKYLIEKMMSRGLINALFATSTVAAGVDFPARSVVISNADTRGNEGWTPLKASELHQMTGRAGRRGKDNVGFVILAPSNFQNPPRIAKLLNSPPEALESRFRATYTSLLNLLDAFGSFKQIKEIVEKSFAFRSASRRILELEKKIKARLEQLKNSLEQSEIGLSVDDAVGFELLTRARLRLQENSLLTLTEIRRAWLRENVKSGRIVSKEKYGKKLLLVISVYGDKVSTIKENGHGLDIPLSQIKKVYGKRYPINDQSIGNAFYDVYNGINPKIEEPKRDFKYENSDGGVGLINSLIEKFTNVCLENGSIEKKQKALWGACQDVKFTQKAKSKIDVLRNEIWLPFENRARVLDHFGYLNFKEQKITEEGKWLADLRIDKPLLVGEIIKEGILDGLEINHMAGLIASLVADSEREYSKIHLSNELMKLLKKVKDIIYKVSKFERDFGVEPENMINFSAATAAEIWASKAKWSDLVWKTKAEEGDLVRLLSRTGEALRQIANLKNSKPEAAKIARATSNTILQAPIR